MNYLSDWKIRIKGTTVFLLLLATGFVISFILYPYAKDYPYQFGPQMIGLFVPPFFTIAYFFYCFCFEELNRTIIAKALVLFLIQLIPFYALLFKETAPYPGEDLARNMIYAKNMIANNTLWGGDELVFDVHSKAYITQPGYRYFVALELLMFQKLYRFVCIVNLLLFVVAVYAYFQMLRKYIAYKKVAVLLALITLLTVPYATKNILMGLSEWLTVVLLILSVYLYLVKKSVASSLIVLALVVFLRQNLLPPVLLLAILMIMSEKQKMVNAIVFTFFLMLPVYHNFYYNNEVRFFISIFNYPFLTYAENNLPANGINYWLLLNNLLHYTGIHLNRNGSVDFIEESFLFLWVFLSLAYVVVRHYLSGNKRIFFLLLLSSIFFPTMILATDFYPRFEFVVVYFFLVSIPLILANSALDTLAMKRLFFKSV